MLNKSTLFFIGVVLVGCSPVRIVDTYVAEEVDFGKYDTFSFTPSDLQDTDEIYNVENLNMLKGAIRKQLELRGIRETQRGELIVNIGVVVEDKVQTRETDIREAPRYMGQRTYAWRSEEVVVREYREGTVTLDMVDRTDNNLIWQGVAAGAISSDIGTMEQRIQKAMEQLFRKFPVEKK